MKVKYFILMFHIFKIISMKKLIDENDLFEIKYTDNYELIHPNTAFLKNFDKFILGHIYAFGKHFKFITHKSKPLHVEVRSEKHGSEHHLHHHYFGNLLWNRHSKVVGYLDDEKFFGFISTADNVYHIERKSHRGLSDKIVMYDELSLHSHSSTKSIFEHYRRDKRDIQLSMMNFIEKPHPIEQRHPRPGIPPFKNKRCSLLFFIDKLVVELYVNNRNMIIGETVNLVQRTTKTFESGDFDFDGYPDKIGIELEHIIILRDQLIHDPRFRGEGNRQKMLHALTRCAILTRTINVCINFCDLGFVLQGVPFELGMAVGPTNDSIYPGICSPPQSVNFNVSNRLQNRITHKNTGIVMNYINGRRLLRFQKAMVLIHEICHVFGGTHDEDSEVRDEDPIHNIMRNNVENIQSLNKMYFPEKTRLEINETLYRQGGCLTDSIKYCGNALVEDDEDCDCGNSTICSFVDPCCEQDICKFKNSVECDPADKCCNFFCRKINNPTVKCNLPCFSDSYCYGRISECPPTKPLRFGSVCYICIAEQCRCDGRGKCIPLEDYLVLRNQTLNIKK